MSKVICDVCGTTYPETASVCPICGCAKNTLDQTGADGVQPDESGTYSYVKGGRFSKTNVRKRNKGSKASGNHSKSETEGTNKGLVVAVLLLLLAIISVLAYIGIRFLSPDADPNPSNTSTTQPSDNTQPSSGSTPPPQIPCTSLKLSNTTIELDKADSTWLLNVETDPADTTDVIAFSSSNEQVATISETGNIVAVGGGEATITVTCGTASAECKVICTFGEPQDPTADTTAPPVIVPPGFELKLNRADFTLTRAGESWVLFKDTASVKASDITWTVDDPKVATVKNGRVVGVDYGDTKVHATFGDQKVSCTVRVRFKAADVVKPKYTLSDKDGDATLYIGGNDTFNLYLTDPEQGNAKVQDVVWVANEEGYVEIDGGTIRALKPTTDLKNKYVVVSVTIEDYTYSCKVRIAEEKTEE